MTTFRVHFSSGAVWDVAAASPAEARRLAQRWTAEYGAVLRCKVLKER